MSFLPEKLTKNFNPGFSNLGNWFKYREIFFEFSILFFIMGLVVDKPYPWHITSYWFISFTIISILFVIKAYFYRSPLASGLLFAAITITTTARCMFLYINGIYAGSIIWFMFLRLFIISWDNIIHPILKNKDVIEAIEILEN